MSYHLQLLEAVERGTLVLFLGADLPQAITGLPSRTDLARGLAQRHTVAHAVSLPSLAQVAQRVSRAGNRFDFTDYLRRELDTAGQPVPAFYHNLAVFTKAHTLPAIITTAYDDFLERALRDAGVPFDRLARGSDVAFARPDRLALIKLYGDVQLPDTLVVTEDDHYGLWRDRDKENLLDEVRGLLKKQSVLFLGYNLSDPDFNLLWREVLDKMGRFARTAYAVWPGLPEGEVQMWRDRMIQVLDADPWGLVEGQERAISVHPTAADLRQFLEKDYDQLLTEGLHDVWVTITGDSPLLKPAATVCWKAITSRFDVPEKMDALFRMIHKTRQPGQDGFTKLTVEQLQSARQGIGYILQFLQTQCPEAGLKLTLNQEPPSPSMSSDIPSIPSKLYQTLQTTLLRCGPFRSDSALAPLFVDSRISPWRDLLPSRDTPVERVQAVIEKLSERNNAQGDNALVLLLCVLRDQTSADDACYEQLDALANDLAVSKP